MKLPRHKLYADAETLFVEGGLNAVGISETLSISEVTLSGWRKKYGWDKKRDDYLASPSKIRELLLTELKSIAEGKKSNIDADALSKIQKVFLSFERQSTSIPVTMSVFKAFDNWLVENAPQMAVPFTEMHKRYLHHLAQQADE